MNTFEPATDGPRRFTRYLAYALAASGLVVLGSSVNYTSASTPVQVAASVTPTGASGSGLVGYRVKLTPTGGDLTDPVLRVEFPHGYRVFPEQSLPQQYAGNPQAPTLPAQCQAPSRIVPAAADRPTELVCFLNAVPAGTSLALHVTAAVDDAVAGTDPVRVVVSGASIDAAVTSTARSR